MHEKVCMLSEFMVCYFQTQLFFYPWFTNFYDTIDKYNFYCKMEMFQWKFTSYSVNNNGIYRNDNHIAIIDVTPRQINDVQCIISKWFWPTSPPPLPKKKIPPTHSRHILVITRGNRYIYVYIWRYGFYPMINNCALVVFILKFIATSRASGIPKMIYTWSKWISKPQAIFKYEYPLIFLLQYRKLIFCVINNYIY